MGQKGSYTDVFEIVLVHIMERILAHLPLPHQLERERERERDSTSSTSNTGQRRLLANIDKVEDEEEKDESPDSLLYRQQI